MMYLKSLSWIIVLTLQIISIKKCFAVDEKAITEILDRYSTQIMGLKQNMMRNFINKRSADLDVFRYERYLHRDLSEVVRQLLAEIDSYDLGDIENPQLRRQLFRITFSEHRLEDPILANYAKGMTSISNILYKKNSCPYGVNDTKECVLAYVPDIVNILKESTNLDEIKHYYTEMRNKNNQITYLHFDSVLKFRSVLPDIVTVSSKTKVFKKEKKEYFFEEGHDLRQELTTAMEELKPSYNKLLSALRSVISSEFPDEIKSDNLVPYYLLEFGKAKLKGDLALLKEFEEYIHSLDVETKKIIVCSIKRFFQHFSISDTIRIIKAIVKNLLNKTPDGKLNYGVYKKIYADIIQYQYETNLLNLSLGFDQEPIPGFGEALENAAVLAVSSIPYLSKVKAFENHTFSAEFESAQLRDKAIDVLFDLQSNFVNEMFMLKVLDTRMKPEQYNEEYWKLMGEIGGFSAPPSRPDVFVDFNYQMYDNFNAYSSLSKIVSQLAGFQIYESFCSSTTFSRCDFSMQKATQRTFSDVILLGGEKSFGDIMEIMTGQGSVSASGILKYFDSYISGLEN